MKHYSSGRRLLGVFVMTVGMAALIGAVYSSVVMDRPALNLILAVGGATVLLTGYAINHVVVRRRVSKRGYFYW